MPMTTAKVPGLQWVVVTRTKQSMVHNLGDIRVLVPITDILSRLVFTFAICCQSRPVVSHKTWFLIFP